jgi:ribonuclease HI
MLVRQLLSEPSGSHPWKNFWVYALNNAYPRLNMGLRLLTSSCSFQLLNQHEASSVLQRHAFAAWAELDIQSTPPPSNTLEPNPNRAKNRQISGNDGRPLSIHSQVKMKPPPAGTLTLVIYPDGSFHRSDQRRTGCGFVIVSGGDGDADSHATEVARGWKKLAPGSNNTAELCAGIEALKWILDHDRHYKHPILILIRFDSTYAEEVTLGQIKPNKNTRLAKHIRSLWLKVLKERTGQAWAWARHVAGHSGHKWNDFAETNSPTRAPQVHLES